MAKSPSKTWPNRQVKHGQIAKQNMAKSPSKTWPNRQVKHGQIAK